MATLLVIVQPSDVRSLFCILISFILSLLKGESKKLAFLLTMDGPISRVTLFTFVDHL